MLGLPMMCPRSDNRLEFSARLLGQFKYFFFISDRIESTDDCVGYFDDV